MTSSESGAEIRSRTNTQIAKTKRICRTLSLAQLFIVLTFSAPQIGIFPCPLPFCPKYTSIPDWPPSPAIFKSCGLLRSHIPMHLHHSVSPSSVVAPLRPFSRKSPHARLITKSTAAFRPLPDSANTRKTMICGGSRVMRQQKSERIREK